MHLARPEVKINLPVNVWVEPDTPLWLETAIACEPWNSIRPCFNIVSDRSQSFVDVLLSTSTWVDMPRADKMHAIVYVDRTWIMPKGNGQFDTSLVRYYLPHELGHTINLADHIRPDSDASKYTNPEICVWDDPNDYNGIMSYCHMKFGEDDKEMMNKHWPPMQRRVIIPMV